MENYSKTLQDSLPKRVQAVVNVILPNIDFQAC